ncbi:MAG TPA: hypothetical protein VI814_12010 [Candidatus Limnocylindria bacterium]
MRYAVRALIVVLALVVMLLTPIVAESPSGTTYLFWGVVMDLVAVAAIAASAATWRRRAA